MAGDYIAAKAALISAVEGITTPIDLTGKVREYGFPGRAIGSAPQAYITPAVPACIYGALDRQASLSSYGVTARFDVVIVVDKLAGEGDAGQVKAAEQAMNALMTAIEADRSLGGTVFDVEARLTAAQGTEFTSFPYGVCYGLVVLTLDREV